MSDNVILNTTPYITGVRSDRNGITIIIKVINNNNSIMGGMRRQSVAISPRYKYKNEILLYTHIVRLIYVYR